MEEPLLALPIVEHSALSLIPEAAASRYCVLPVRIDRDRLVIAISSPFDFEAMDNLRIMTGLELLPLAFPSKEIRRAILRYYGTWNAIEAAHHFPSEKNSDERESAPAVRLMDGVIRAAVGMGASDIHVEPFAHELRIRCRVDGLLQPLLTVDPSALSSLMTRIKILGGMNIAEKRLPQDGAVQLPANGDDVDLRISIIPTIHGEKAVLRILDRSRLRMNTEQLGMTEKNLSLFHQMLSAPHGILLVCGPTGSGKSTTLYAALSELNRMDRNIVTIEDPVEFQLDGINQIQINPKAGLTFSTGLRSILRQDPDIVMIGEIRDSETAEIAVRAGITGHLVLSTLHTNDGISAVTRLENMGIAPYLIGAALLGIVSQRLVRTVCSHCREVYLSSPEEKRLLGIDPMKTLSLVRGKGCALCGGTGYLGRCGVHEVIPLTGILRGMIEDGASAKALELALQKLGRHTLRENAAALVQMQRTSMEEFLRAIYTME